MICNKVKDGLANVTMGTVEARVLHDALTIAKLSIGADLLIGDAGRAWGINVEHLRGVLIGIAGEGEWKKPS